MDARGAWLSTLPAPDIGSVYFRCPTLFERRIMPVNYSGRIPTPPALGNTPQLRMEAWLMRGVIREDDLNPSSYADPNDRPDSDPWGDLDRPRYHFYSPVTNSSDGLLTLSALPWAFGVADPFAASPAPDTNRINHFSYADATRDLFLALTYKQDEPVNQVKSRADAAVRLSLFAGTLKSLGHVIHLLQDTSSTACPWRGTQLRVPRLLLSIRTSPIRPMNFTNYPGDERLQPASSAGR
ncbi:MAG: hypothetical protein IPH50_02950 [Rhodanobacteraceae bacterium]|nr:hypothetical protein [Rhodanobacteraceae bacterium]